MEQPIIIDNHEFISEDKKTKMSLTITTKGTIFKIFELNSPPQIILLTIMSVYNKLKELEIESVYNLINKNELNMFKNKEISHEYEETVLIKIKKEYFCEEMTKILGIYDLIL